MPVLQPRGDCIVDIVGVFVHVTETDKLTDRYRQTYRDRQTETEAPRAQAAGSHTNIQPPRILVGVLCERLPPQSGVNM